MASSCNLKSNNCHNFFLKKSVSSNSTAEQEKEAIFYFSSESGIGKYLPKEKNGKMKGHSLPPFTPPKCKTIEKKAFRAGRAYNLNHTIHTPIQNTS